MRDLSSNTTYRRAFAVTIAIPPLLLALVAGALYWQTAILIDRSDWVEHTAVVIGHLHEIEARIFHIESRARAYALRHDESLIADREARIERVRTELRRLEELVADNPPQVATVRRIEALVRDWQRYLDRLSDAAPADAAALIDDAGIPLGDRIHHQTDAMILVEQELEAARVASAQRAEERTLIANLGLGTAVGFAISVLLGGQLLALERFHRGMLLELETRAEALSSSEQRFRLIVEGVPETAIFLVDPAGRIATWNAGAERILGWRAEEIVGRPLSTVYPGGVSEPLDEWLEHATTHGRAAMEARRRRKDGSVFWADVSLATLRGMRGETLGYVKILRDVSERKLAEAARKRASAELERRVDERTRELAALNAALRTANEDLEAFGYSVSHDLRTPLRAIHGFADALLEDCGAALGAEHRGYVEHIIDGARRLDGLIADLLAYARLSRQELDARAVSLESAVDEALAVLADEIAASQGDVSVARPLPVVHGHRQTVVLALQNLVGNALKFVAPGTRPRVRVSAETRGDRARLVVEDEGIGVPAPYRERIFRVFERLHGAEAFPGTGVGLAIVKKGIERMGGSVGIEPAASGGSRFWFELPREAA